MSVEWDGENAEVSLRYGEDIEERMERFADELEALKSETRDANGFLLAHPDDRWDELEDTMAVFDQIKRVETELELLELYLERVNYLEVPAR